MHTSSSTSSGRSTCYKAAVELRGHLWWERVHVTSSLMARDPCKQYTARTCIDLGSRRASRLLLLHLNLHHAMREDGHTLRNLPAQHSSLHCSKA